MMSHVCCVQSHHRIIRSTVVSNSLLKIEYGTQFLELCKLQVLIALVVGTNLVQLST